MWWFLCLDLPCSLSCPLHPHVVPKHLCMPGVLTVLSLSRTWPFFFSVWASSLKHLHLYSNPTDSGVPLKSLWCLSCSCCLGCLTTGELNPEVQTVLSWNECLGGDEHWEHHMCFNNQVEYWLVLCWTHGGHRHRSWTLVISTSCPFLYR